jgi:3-oxoacyl-[acyl-carrier-protein] synthase-3
MSIPTRAIISGTGLAVPSEILDNAFFTRYLDTSDEWIVTRSGIRNRFRAVEGETTVTLARDAARVALAEAGIAPQDLDLIILASVTPDTIVPAGSAWLQAELGATGVPAHDVNAACSSMAYSMAQASLYIASGQYKNILVVGADTLSRIVDYEDRATCVLFGDAASAMVFTASPDPDRGLLYHRLGADGTGAEYIHVVAGGSRVPASKMTVAEKLHVVRMNGREVYKFAVKKFNELVELTLAENNLQPEDIDLIIPHQSNLRIIASVQEKLGLPDERILVNIQKYGNTSSASIGLALHEARQQGRAKPGDMVMFITFGAGLTWAVLLFRM